MKRRWLAAAGAAVVLVAAAAYVAGLRKDSALATSVIVLEPQEPAGFNIAGGSTKSLTVRATRDGEPVEWEPFEVTVSGAGEIAAPDRHRRIGEKKAAPTGAAVYESQVDGYLTVWYETKPSESGKTGTVTIRSVNDGATATYTARIQPPASEDQFSYDWELRVTGSEMALALRVRHADGTPVTENEGIVVSWSSPDNLPLAMTQAYLTQGRYFVLIRSVAAGRVVAELKQYRPALDSFQPIATTTYHIDPRATHTPGAARPPQ